jgi:hypothetical protein
MSADPQAQGAWLNFFRSLTPDQQSLFSQASTASSATSPQSISSVANSPVPVGESLPPMPQVMPAGAQNATRVAGRRLQAGRIKKRPLNAFIAFRSKISCLPRAKKFH